MQRTVLIVEDCEDAAAPLAVALQGMIGVRVQLFSSARDALTMLEGSPYHVAAVVTDLLMPSLEGFELIRLIRNDRRDACLPIVVVSGDTHRDTLERVFRLGVDAYFPKPYSPAQIQHKLESLLNVR